MFKLDLTSYHIFFFDDGCIAFWALSHEEQTKICTQVKAFVNGALSEQEVEEMPYPTALLPPLPLPPPRLAHSIFTFH